MGVEDLPWVEVTSREQWRAWLASHHAEAEGAWVVRYKKHCGDRHVPWADMVQECLCFGWIDGLTKRIDEDRVRGRVTPRRKGSIWSAINKGHVAELADKGLIEPSGQAVIDRAQADGSWVFLDDIDALVVPDDLGDALTAAGLRESWEATSPSLRKQHLYAIKTAKRSATRTKRIETVVGALDQQKL